MKSMGQYCSPYSDSKSRKERFQKRKLGILEYYRDSLERRLSAINASIKTLKQQMEKSEIHDS